MNLITITYKSEAPYSTEEIDSLNAEMRAIVSDYDGDADVESVAVKVETEKEVEDRRYNDAMEYISDGKAIISVQINDSHGRSIMDFEERASFGDSE